MSPKNLTKPALTPALPNLGAEQVEEAFRRVVVEKADVLELLRERAGYLTLADARAIRPLKEVHP